MSVSQGPVHHRQPGRRHRRRHQPIEARIGRPRRARRLGPPGIDWALAHPERVAGLVLLNTYYCEMPTLRRPEAIWLFSTPVVRSIARPVSRMFGNGFFRRIYWWQVGRFIRDADVRREFVPLLYQQFDAMPSARPAFFRLN